jgi:integrase
MKRRRNPFPGVTRITDRHGKVRWRLRKNGVDTYLPGPYGSAEFRVAYETAIEAGPIRSKSAARGTLAWLIETYLESPKFRGMAASSRYSQRRQFDWLRGIAGDLPFARFEVRHVEAIMAKKEGPHAANSAAKRLSSLFAYAQRMGLVHHNPARHAERRKTGGDGFHTWTDAEIAKFRQHYPEGSKARLALALILNTGAARQDVCRMGWQNVSEGRIRYRRGKTMVEGDLPLLADLSAELTHVPRDRLLFLATAGGKPYTVESFGNLFREWCVQAGLPHCTAHGLRKAGATRLANAGASEHMVMAYLAHSSPREGATYTKKAERSRLADSAFALLKRAKGEQKLSNLSEKLDTIEQQNIETKG